MRGDQLLGLGAPLTGAVVNPRAPVAVALEHLITELLLRSAVTVR